MRRRRQASVGNSGGPSARSPRQRMTPALQAVCCSLAWAIDALATASASLAWATAASKSPAAAAFLAAAKACSVGIHWFFNAPASCSAASAAASAVLKSASLLAACAAPAQTNQHVTARYIRMRMLPAPPLRPRARPGDRQAVAHVGQIIFDVAIKLVLRLERHAADLDVAGDQPPAHRAHAAPLRAIDRHRGDDAERRRQHFGADMIAGILYVAGSAGEIELAAPRIKILGALFVGHKRARIVRDLDVERFSARGVGHIRRQRRHLVLDVGIRLLAIGFPTTIKRQLERDHLTGFLVEIRIVLADADALVGKTIAVGLAVLERGGE